MLITGRSRIFVNHSYECQVCSWRTRQTSYRQTVCPCLSKHSSEFSHGHLRAQHSWVVCGVSRVQHVHQHCSVSVLASRNKEEPETGTGCGPETHLGHSLISTWGHTSPLPQQIRDCTGLECIFFTAACLVLYFRFATKTILITQ